mmetsp:Transcript_23486/g.59373  ORF Transcript_23486/g.59373 Transcript_23486/m.59373 type:complete len:212 (-) Transcript_23486:198-833(-)
MVRIEARPSLCVCTLTHSTICLRVYSSGPSRSYTPPSLTGSKTTARMASATSSTYTGLILLLAAPYMGHTPMIWYHLAMRLRNLSSSPNMTEGRTMVAPGKWERTACSPSALRRTHSEGDPSSAARADTWIRRGTPASAHARAMLCAVSTFAPKKLKFIVSSCLPMQLMTMSERSTVLTIESKSRAWKGMGTIIPRSPISFRCLLSSSLPR